MMRTKVLFRHNEKTSLRRIVWSENAEAIAAKLTVDGKPRWTEVKRWVTHNWGEKVDGKFRYSFDELVEFCIAQKVVSVNEETGMPKLPGHCNRFHLQEKLEGTGHDPEE